MDFSKLNETDVREEIIAPLVRELGYRSATEHNVLREQILSYPKAWLGRKDAKKDPLLRGKADYILEAGGRVRWVIEAKSPSCDLNKDEIQQAWTYANHPEVRAVYFALCNGRRFVVYRTSHGPDVEPILAFDYGQLYVEAVKTILANTLAPLAILRNHPDAVIDIHPPLGPGLRSIARVTGGYISYEKSTLQIPSLLELQISIVAGAIERNGNNQLMAFLESRSPTRSIQDFTERLGLTKFELSSDHTTLSTDLGRPSQFRYSASVIFPAGEELMDINTWTRVTLPQNMHIQTFVVAQGVLEGNDFKGVLTNHVVIDDRVSIELEGKFCLCIT